MNDHRGPVTGLVISCVIFTSTIQTLIFTPDHIRFWWGVAICAITFFTGLSYYHELTRNHL